MPLVFHVAVLKLWLAFSTTVDPSVLSRMMGSERLLLTVVAGGLALVFKEKRPRFTQKAKRKYSKSWE